MTEYIVMLINTFLMANFHIYCWKKLQINHSNKIFDLNYVITLCFSIATIYISNYVFVQPIKLIIISILLIAINYFLITKEIKQSIILVVISQMISAFAETSFVFVCSMIFDNKIYQLLFEPIPSIFLNLYILSVSIFITNSKFIKRL